jgi:hypothetical protein
MLVVALMGFVLCVAFRLCTLDMLIEIDPKIINEIPCLIERLTKVDERGQRVLSKLSCHGRSILWEVWPMVVEVSIFEAPSSVSARQNTTRICQWAS